MNKVTVIGYITNEEMKKDVLRLSVVCLAIGLLLTGCHYSGIATQPVAGTIDEPLAADTMPHHVLQAMDSATRFHNYELMSDAEHEISVSAIDSVDTISTEGYGIVVTKGAVSTTLSDIRTTRQPQACYDAATGDLWLATTAMEGTGIRTEWLCQLRFNGDGTAFVKTRVNPYTVQQELLKRLAYSISGETITLFDGEQKLATATNSVTDMGGFDDEQPLWIGEQLYYDLSADRPRLLVVPGVKFVTGLVLHYDDMPELSAPITVADDGSITIEELSVL